MIRDEILKLAKECGDMTMDNRRRIDFCFDDHGIERFARLVRDAALEEAAKLCEHEMPKESLYLDAHQISANVLKDCANKLRKLKDNNNDTR